MEGNQVTSIEANYQMDDEWKTQKEQPEIHMKSIAKYILAQIVKPASSEGGPQPFTQHLKCLKSIFGALHFEASII